MNGKHPHEISAALIDCEMFAGPKGEDDVRPIGIGGTFRKIAATVLFKSSQVFNAKHFGRLQFALLKSGTDQIIHAFVMSLTSAPNKCKFAMDAINAFNKANRKRGLAEVFTYFKQALPYLLTMYGDDLNCWYYGLPDAIAAIKAQEGFTQGDVMATWAYIMTIQPFLKGIHSRLGDEGFVKFFVDDGNLCGDFEDMLDVIDYIIQVGPTYGYHMSKVKGSYLLGKCENRELAVERKALLVEKFEMSPDMIHIHPDNAEVDDRDKVALEYGMVMLGFTLEVMST